MAPNRSGSPSSRHDHHDPPADMVASYGAGGVSLTPIRLWDSSPSHVVVWALGGACVAGKTPQRICGSRSFAGLLDLAINWSIFKVSFHYFSLYPASPFLASRPEWSKLTTLDFLSSIGIAALFTAGGLFGDLIESWRFPRRREEESQVVREIAQQASGPS